MNPKDKLKFRLKASIPLVSIVLLLFLPSSIVTPVMGAIEAVIQQTVTTRMLGD